MNYSTKIAERQWNLPDKGERESKREEVFMDDIVQKNHIEKELLSNLDGIETVFDGGAGCGRFSILLAKKGCKVTHFDISQPMLDKAYEFAKAANVLSNITFIKGELEDLTAYTDHSFDLVISFDAPISYTYPNQESVIGELVRIARKRIMLSVSSRLGSLPYLANPMNKNQFVLDDNCSDPWVQWCLENWDNAVENFHFNKTLCDAWFYQGIGDCANEIADYEAGGTPWVLTYLFLPDELQGILERFGVKNVRLAGPGAYARTIPKAILRKIMGDPGQKEAFLEFCYEYDRNPYVLGMGKDNLFAKGEIG